MPTTIEAIEPIPFRLPLREPLRWGAASVLPEVRHVLVRVRLRDGSEGWGEAPPRPTIYGETVYSICSVIRQELAPRLVGEQLDEFTFFLPTWSERGLVGLRGFSGPRPVDLPNGLWCEQPGGVL